MTLFGFTNIFTCYLFVLYLTSKIKTKQPYDIQFSYFPYKYYAFSNFGFFLASLILTFLLERLILDYLPTWFILFIVPLLSF